MTCESESKVGLFSPFPQQPAFDRARHLCLWEIVFDAQQNLTTTGFKHQSHVNHMRGQYYSVRMYCVVNTNDLLAKLVGLTESIENSLILLLKEQQALVDCHFEFHRVSESSALPPTMQDKNRTQKTFSSKSTFSCIEGCIWSSWPNPWKPN